MYDKMHMVHQINCEPFGYGVDDSRPVEASNMTEELDDEFIGDWTNSENTGQSSGYFTWFKEILHIA